MFDVQVLTSSDVQLNTCIGCSSSVVGSLLTSMTSWFAIVAHDLVIKHWWIFCCRVCTGTRPRLKSAHYVAECPTMKTPCHHTAECQNDNARQEILKVNGRGRRCFSDIEVGVCWDLSTDSSFRLNPFFPPTKFLRQSCEELCGSI